MKENIVVLHENPKEIDLSYFDNYGGYGYSESYKNYTLDPAFVLGTLAENNIFFQTLLDAGCASGELVRDFRRLGIQAYGIEKNKDILKKSVVPRYCTQMDIRDLSSIEVGSFDIIYCNSAMYLFPQEIPELLREFYRICKKGVYLCNPFLSKGSESEVFKDPSRTFLATETWWNKQFAEANFKRVAPNIYIKSKN